MEPGSSFRWLHFSGFESNSSLKTIKRRNFRICVLLETQSLLMILCSFCLASPIFVKTELLPLEDLFLASSDQVGHISHKVYILNQLKYNTYNWNQLSGISPHLANNLTSIHVCVEVSENHSLSIWLGLRLLPFFPKAFSLKDDTLKKDWSWSSFTVTFHFQPLR